MREKQADIFYVCLFLFLINIGETDKDNSYENLLLV